MKNYNNYMSIDKFYKYMSNSHPDEYIVKIAYRYSIPGEEYTISNEVCSLDPDGNIIWFYDWNEGQDDVKVIAWCPVDVATNAWLERDDGYGT